MYGKQLRLNSKPSHTSYAYMHALGNINNVSLFLDLINNTKTPVKKTPNVPKPRPFPDRPGVDPIKVPAGMRRIRLDDEPGPVVHEDPFHRGEVGVALERLADVVDAVV